MSFIFKSKKVIKNLTLVAAIFICCSSTAQAQNNREPKLGSTEIAVAMASMYKSANDTLQNITYLTRGNEVQVLNIDDYYWVVVSRENQLFFVNRQALGFITPHLPPVSIEAISSVPRENNGEIHYTSVIAVDGRSQNDLYLRAKAWVINVFKSPKDVITVEEKDVGIIICKGYTEENVQIYSGRSIPIKLYFTIKVSTKDGRYKYDIMDFYFQRYSSSENTSPDKFSATEYLNTALNPNSRQKYVSQQYTQALIKKVALLESSVKKALSNDEDW